MIFEQLYSNNLFIYNFCSLFARVISSVLKYLNELLSNATYKQMLMTQKIVINLICIGVEHIHHRVSVDMVKTSRFISEPKLTHDHNK